MSLKPIVGIGVAKYFSEVVIISPSNEIIIASLSITIVLLTLIGLFLSLKSRKVFYNSPIIFMESPGHCHKIFSHLYTNHGWDISIINPIQFNSIKNVGVRKEKNDESDALENALNYRLNHSNISSLPSETLDCFKNLCPQYYALSDKLTFYKYKFTSTIGQIMLNFKDVFPDVCSKTALAIFENYTTPDDILNTNRKELISIIQQNSKKVTNGQRF